MPNSSGGNPYPSAPPAILSQTTDINDDASIDAHASILLTALSVSNNQQQEIWVPTPALHLPPALEKIALHLPPALEKIVSLVLDHMVPALWVEMYFLIEDGGEEVRLSVLAAVKRAVHFIMGIDKGVALFGALLYTCDYCEERFDELQAIVQALTSDNDDSGFLACNMKEDRRRRHWLQAMRELAMAVSPQPQLCMSLIAWLLRARLSEHCEGALPIMNHGFDTMVYRRRSIIIPFAIANIDTVLSSEFGSQLLGECFKNAVRDGDCALEEIILSRTSEIAKGKYSNFFLRRVLKLGTVTLKDAVAKRVAEDFVSLSVHQFGTLVVEACILETSSVSTAPLQRVLDAVLALPDDQLAEMVQGGCSNDVVRTMLAAGKKFFPEQTTELAQRILKLPAAGQRAMLRAAL